MQLRNTKSHPSETAAFQAASREQGSTASATTQDKLESPAARSNSSQAPALAALQAPHATLPVARTLPPLPSLDECGEINARALRLHDEAVAGKAVNYGRLIMAGALYRLVLDSLPLLGTSAKSLGEMLNSVRNSHATVSRDLGQHARAIGLFEQIAADQMAQMDPNTTATLLNLANTLFKGGHLEQALERASQSLEWATTVMVGAYRAIETDPEKMFYRNMFEQGSAGRLNSLNLLHEIHETVATRQEAQDLATSDAMRLATLALFRQHLGSEDPETLEVAAAVANNRAFARIQRGLDKEAVPLLKEAVALAQRLENTDLQAFLERRLKACEAATAG